MDKRFAEIIVNNKCRETDRPFSYAVPEGLKEGICPGSRVIVPFGKGNKQLEGYVLCLKARSDIDAAKLKPISRLIDHETVLSEKMLELAKWMREKYLCYYIEAIQAIVPSPIRTKSSVVVELQEGAETEEKLRKLQPGIMLQILEYLEAKGGSAGMDELRSYFQGAKIDGTIKKLEEMGIILKSQIIGHKIGKKTEKFYHAHEQAAQLVGKRAKKQLELLEHISRNPGIAHTELKQLYGDCDGALRILLEKGCIAVNERDSYRELKSGVYAEIRHPLTLDQQNALLLMEGYFRQKKNVLLHGVTGSGKTEVYLEIIEAYMSKGKASIVLVPEISLTPQMISRFKNRFGDAVAVLHSGLSEGEKYDEWRRIRAGRVKVAVGARSAVFAPFDNLGIIIIDEEHEHTYKSEIKPKYLTWEVAEKRCQLEDAHLILGSATPAIETYYRAMSGTLGLVELPKRANGSDMPEVVVVDMREELKNGNKTIFSDSLKEAVEENLKKGNQMILFLNRRGYSTFVSCRQCGLVMRCPRCSISLTYHMKENKLTCHYCGYERENPKQCPKCASDKIKYFGVGTQKVEKEFQKTFSIQNTLRMDADTTSAKNAHEQLLTRFRNKESKVLLGTQMISKGLDFPDVTLVGVIAADTSLNLPDFRSAERTFQMIAQVAGRSGRGAKSGRVVVQTYCPEHYSIQFAQAHDYKGFYRQEIMLRKELGYPPFSSLVNLMVSGMNLKKVMEAAEKIDAFVSPALKAAGIEKLGPAPAPLSRIKNRHRWQIILKGEDGQNLRDVAAALLSSGLTELPEVTVSIDLNPLNML